MKMKNILYGINTLVLAILLNSCLGAPGDSEVTNNPSVISSSNDIYIDMDKGLDDSNQTGRKNSPFKTIWYALSKSKSSNTLYISGGEYTEENGEKFPLIFLNKNLLYSSDNNKTVLIRGSGEFQNNEVAIVLEGDNQLQGITISSNENIGVLSKNGESSIVSSTFKDNKVALSEHNNSIIHLINSHINNNSKRGVELIDSSSLELTSSIISNSYVGINIRDDAKIIATSQNSKIINNDLCDLFTNSESDMNLQGIEWDDNISDFNIETDCINGNNIVRGDLSQAHIIFQPIVNDNSNEDDNNSFYNPNVLIFNNTHKIDILQPSYNELIETTEPIIKYKNTIENKYIMVSIWNNEPKIQAGRVTNSKEMVWYWHTGMDNSGIGYVEYAKGANPINGIINTGIRNENSSVTPLLSGRTYYLVVWEWDVNGREIISSSTDSIFHVR